MKLTSLDVTREMATANIFRDRLALVPDDCSTAQIATLLAESRNEAQAYSESQLEACVDTDRFKRFRQLTWTEATVPVSRLWVWPATGNTAGNGPLTWMMIAMAKAGIVECRAFIGTKPRRIEST